MPPNSISFSLKLYAIGVLYSLNNIEASRNCLDITLSICLTVCPWQEIKSYFEASQENRFILSINIFVIFCPSNILLLSQESLVEKRNAFSSFVYANV